MLHRADTCRMLSAATSLALSPHLSSARASLWAKSLDIFIVSNRNIYMYIPEATSTVRVSVILLEVRKDTVEQ